MKLDFLIILVSALENSRESERRGETSLDFGTQYRMSVLSGSCYDGDEFGERFLSSVYENRSALERRKKSIKVFFLSLHFIPHISKSNKEKCIEGIK